VAANSLISNCKDSPHRFFHDAIYAPANQERVPSGLEDAWFVSAEIIREDQIESMAGLRLMFVMPSGVVPTATSNHLLRAQAKQAVPGADRQ
jgi:hypothetical protein